jgi:phosphotransferase system enzyme I (PtsI)
METRHGIAVFPGVAIGPALVLDQEGFRVARQHIAPATVDAEVARLERAVAALADEMRQTAQIVADRLGPEVAKIFEAHGSLLCDRHLRTMLTTQIREGCHSAEFAVQTVFGRIADDFQRLSKGHFADRATDIHDVERHLLACLLGDRRRSLDSLTQPVIVLAPDLTPSETASFNPRLVVGLATEMGGRTSHTAIVAGALEIPAVVGLGRFLTDISDGDWVILDGNRGLVIVEPDEPTLQRYQSDLREFRRFEQSLGELRDLPAETIDGVRVQLMANIEFADETAHCIERGADGIGLYRTEFLYLDRDHPPTEEDHFEAYAQVVREMGPDRPVVFRTMDLGADKVQYRTDQPEPNPVLGLRSIRLSLRDLPMFQTQLRALLRVSALGDVRIMFPLVSTLMELRRCRMILRDVMEDLEDAGTPFRHDVPVGMMVEVPSAALLSEQFARQVDFLSIGTNDLIQYTLAVDRTNETVAPLYSASDPAVIRLVRTVVRAANRHGTAVNVCGEMSGDPIYTMLLLGLGLRQLSVTPHNIPEIKKIVRSITIAEAKKVASRALRLDTARDVTNYLRNRAKRIIPELVDGTSF